jgi:hypothetical protein
MVTLYHLPLPHLSPNVHHLHLPLYLPRESCITSLSNGNNPPGDSWPPQRHRGLISQRCRKVKMKVRNRHCQSTVGDKLRTHLFALTIASPKTRCCVESSLQNVTRIMLVSLHFKTPMAICGATKSVLNLNLFLLVLTTMHCTALSTHLTGWTILFSQTRAQ